MMGGPFWKSCHTQCGTEVTLTPFYICDEVNQGIRLVIDDTAPLSFKYLCRRGISPTFIYGSRPVALRRLVRCTYTLPGDSQNYQATHIKGGLVIFLRGGVSWLANKGTLAYHAIWCGRARVMVNYAICTDPGI